MQPRGAGCSGTRASLVSAARRFLKHRVSPHRRSPTSRRPIHLPRRAAAALFPHGASAWPRAADALLLACVLLPALIFGGVALHDHGRALDAAGRETLATLDALHAHAERTLLFQALALGATEDRLHGLTDAEIRAPASGLHGFLAGLRRHAGGEIGIVVFDAEGRPLVESDRAMPPEVSVADRDYFRHHRDTPGTAPRLAQPLRSRANGQEILLVTMRRESASGDFAGVIAAGVRRATLADTWARAAPAPDAAVTLFRRDGTLLLRHPRPGPDTPPRFDPQGWVMRAVAAGAERQLLAGPSPVDGTQRIFGFRAIARFPDLLIAHGVSRDQVLAAWRGRVWVYGAFAAVATLALGLGGLFARGRARALRALAETLERRVEARTAEARDGEARVRFLAGEVDHRAKNLLAVVQATLRLTPRHDAEAYARAVEGRIAALARAQTLLAEDRWQGAELRAVLAAELEPFLGPGRGAAVLDGPALALPPEAVQPLAMAVHELATNAVKHGALSVPGGRLRIGWSVDAAGLELRWAETGGPALAGAPCRRGFGTRVLDGVIRGQLGGQAALDWRPEGLRCTLRVPAARLTGGGLRGGA